MNALQVVLKSSVYAAALPSVIDAIFLPVDGPVHNRAGNVAQASRMRKALIGRYWSNPPISVPLLAFHVDEARKGQSPFTCIEGCESR